MPEQIPGIARAPVTDEFMQELVRAFRPTEVKPGMHPDKIMYEAGCARVVQYIREKLDLYKRVDGTVHDG